MTSSPAFSNSETAAAQPRTLSPREKARAEGRRRAEEARQKLLAEAAKGAAPKKTTSRTTKTASRATATPPPIVRPGREQDLLDGKAEYKLVPIDSLKRDPEQPRRTFRNIDLLAANLKVRGLKQPVTARPDPAGTGLIIMYGERRYRAAKGGWSHVPTIIRYGVDPADILADQLTENMHREDMDHIEEAHGIRLFMKRKKIGTYAEAAQQLGLSLSSVVNKIALLDLDDEDQERVSSGELTLIAGATKARKKMGKVRKSYGGRPRVAPHFSDEHRLAGRARSRCNAATKANETHGIKVGSVACGACWEVVIRLDAQSNPDIHAGDHE